MNQAATPVFPLEQNSSMLLREFCLAQRLLHESLRVVETLMAVPRHSTSILPNSPTRICLS